MAVTWSYSELNDELFVNGDGNANLLRIYRDSLGNLVVEGITTVSDNVSLIRMTGAGGNDSLLLQGGNIPAAIISGGAGRDTITGAGENDTLNGDGNDDTISGFGGADVVHGGTGNDRLTDDAGEGDQLFGDDGNDTLTWSGLAGNTQDLIEGGAGTDTARLFTFQSEVSNTFSFTADSGRISFKRDDSVFAIDIGSVEKIVYTAGGFNDKISVDPAIGPGVSFEIDGGGGPDTLSGGSGDDILRGGPDSGGFGSSFTGGKGNDLLIGGEENDIFRWFAGDGSDVVEAKEERDFDTLNVVGNAEVEALSVGVSSGRLKVTRNASEGVDSAGIEFLSIDGNGGNDTITIGDLTGGFPGGFILVGLRAVLEDPGSNLLVVNGTAAANSISLAPGGAASFNINGLPWAIQVIESQAGDRLVLDGGAGDDVLNLASAPNLITLDLRGGAGSDVIDGNGAANRLDGGTGEDVLIGGAGNDSYLVDDVSDVVTERGGGGTDSVTAVVSWTLGAYVENLTLGGIAAINGTGNAAANVLTGNPAANVLTGRGGADTLSAGNGIDTVNGGAGADRIYGGLGNDRLKGDDSAAERGKDGFYFNTAPDASTNRDTILDFNPADDSIHLKKSGVFAGIAATGTLSAAAFKQIDNYDPANPGARTGTTDDYRIIYDKVSGKLYYDADGHGGTATAVLFAIINNGTTHPTLTNADFIVF